MRRAKHQTAAQPAHVRAPENLLAVCAMGMDSPDPEAVVVYALLAKAIRATAANWGPNGPQVLDSDKREAAAAAGARK